MLIMKFALFLLGSWTEPEVGAQSRIFDEMVEQAEYAEELGFDSIWIAEHHSSRYGDLSVPDAAADPHRGANKGRCASGPA